MNSFGFSSEWGCEQYRVFLPAYLDGELDPAKQLVMERHVVECAECSERVVFGRAMGQSVRGIVGKVRAPASLRARVEEAMLVESQLTGVGLEQRRRYLTRVGVMAACLLVVGLFVAHRRAQSTTPFELDDELLAEMVSEHSRPLPPERTDPKQVRALEQYVGVPVSLDDFERRTGARLVGGRVMPMLRERAAMLQYEIGDGMNARRVSVFVYDPNRVHVQSSALYPRSVGSSEMRVGRANGYSVVVTQRSGIGYAVASDMDAEQNARLAAF